MGDAEDGSVLLQPFEGGLHFAFALGIEGGGGFVENQDRRVAHEGAGDRKPLALTTRQRDATFTHRGIVALGHGRDEVVREGGPGRGLDFRPGGAWTSRRRYSPPR